MQFHWHWQKNCTKREHHILYHFLVKYCHHEEDCTDEDKHSICDCQSATCICKLGFSKLKPGGKCEETGKHLKSIFFQLIHFVSFPSKTMQQRVQLHYWGWKQYLRYSKRKVYLFVRFCHWSWWVVWYVSYNIGFQKSPFFVDPFFYD